ncbi:hypothetical protein [Cryobacterium sp. Y62]|uniref:hypothetical protein n=1 Tax=Cryobacterium sp. Y62 TaxID=2048284 RepID=UPI0011AFE76F|nr:hypothetical protein [Cryobacterium sp. Y62]
MSAIRMAANLVSVMAEVILIEPFGRVGLDPQARVAPTKNLTMSEPDCTSDGPTAPSLPVEVRRQPDFRSSVTNNFHAYDADLERDGFGTVYKDGFEVDWRTGEVTSWRNHRDNMNTWTFDERDGCTSRFEFPAPLSGEAKNGVVADCLDSIGFLVFAYRRDEREGTAEALDRIEQILECSADFSADWQHEVAVAFSEQIDEAEDELIFEGVTVHTDELYEYRSLTDDRTGVSLGVDFTFASTASIRSQWKVALGVLRELVAEHDDNEG